MIKLDEEKIKEILNNDGVIAFVTDTVWGLGCLPTSKKAVEKIYEIKHRDAKKPLILMSNDIQHLKKYIKPLPNLARNLIKDHFPGALTLVLNKSDNTPDYVTSDMPTVGIRVPDNKVFAAICECTDGHVLATTSANLSNEPTALTYAQAVEYIGDKVDLVVEDFGVKAKGRASTVAGINPRGIKIFRQGDVVIKEPRFLHSPQNI